MPLDAGQWGAVITRAKENLDSAGTLASAFDANATYPAALSGVEKYKGTLQAPARQAIRADFVALIDRVIADLTAARNAP